MTLNTQRHVIGQHEQHDPPPLKSGGTQCAGRVHVSSSCFTSDIRRVTLVKNPMTSHKCDARSLLQIRIKKLNGSMSTRKTAIIKDPNVAKYPFMIYHRVYNTTGATSGAGTAYPSGAPEFTVGFNGDRVARSIIVFVMFYRSLFAFLPFSVGHCVLYVRFTDTDYPFGISNLVLLC